MTRWQMILDDYIRYMQAVNRGGGRKRQFDNSKSDKDNKKEQRNGNANGHKQARFHKWIHPKIIANSKPDLIFH